MYVIVRAKFISYEVQAATYTSKTRGGDTNMGSSRANELPKVKRLLQVMGGVSFMRESIDGAGGRLG